MKIYIFVIVFILFMPIIIPYTIISFKLEEQRKKRCAKGFSCLNCGEVLGEYSLQLSDEKCIEDGNELRKKYPGCRIRYERNVHAICSKCSTSYVYKPKENTFKIYEELNNENTNKST